MSVDRSCIRKEKIADSKRYGYTCGRGLPVLEEVFFNYSLFFLFCKLQFNLYNKVQFGNNF